MWSSLSTARAGWLRASHAGYVAVRAATTRPPTPRRRSESPFRHDTSLITSAVRHFRQAERLTFAMLK